jgi:3-(3-hydroxy-phenyl)propionate hydroxylase
MKDFVSLANPVLAKTRNVVVKTLLRTPRVGDYIREARFKPPPTYPNGDYFGLPRSRRNGAEGRPIPQPQVRTYDGRRALLDDLLGEDYALVGYACDPRVSLDAKTLARLTALGARFVALYPFGGRPQGDAVKRGSAVDALIEVEDLGGEGIAWFRGAGARKGHVALVRPDKFVYALTPAAQLGQAIQQALDVFGENATAAKGGSPSDLHAGAQTPVSA